MKMDKAMNTNRVSDDELISLVENAFAPLALDAKISDFEVNVERDNGKVKVLVTVIGMAETPTLEECKEFILRKGKSLKLSREDVGSITLKFDAKNSINQNSNDYILEYNG
jgi:hypothetical protein